MSGKLHKIAREKANQKVAQETTAFLTSIYLNCPLLLPRFIWRKIVNYVMGRYQAR